MILNRREMCLLLPVILPIASQSAGSQESSLNSGAFRHDQLPLHIDNNNAHIRMIMRGKLATGEGIEGTVRDQRPDGC